MGCTIRECIGNSVNDGKIRGHSRRELGLGLYSARYEAFGMVCNDVGELVRGIVWRKGECARGRKL